jgi:hypothetical protein
MGQAHEASSETEKRVNCRHCPGRKALREKRMSEGEGGHAAGKSPTKTNKWPGLGDERAIRFAGH